MAITNNTADTLGSDQKYIELSTFQVVGEWFAMDVLKVQEVMLPIKISTLPLAPEYIMGLINVRGLIVTAISLKQRLGFEQLTYGEEYHNMLVNTPDGIICLMVDEIGDVVDITQQDIFERPATVSNISTRFIQGVFKMEDQLVTILDVDAVCAP